MAEIIEVFEDIKEKVGDKTFYILGAGALLFGLYNLSKGSGGDSSDNLVPVTNVASYPDAVTNADVIIGTLQDSIDYSEGVILEKIEEGNIAIDEKLEANKQLFDTAFENIQGSLTDLDKNVTTINGTLTSMDKNISNISKEQTNISNTINTINTALKNNAKKPASTSGATTTKKPASGSGATTTKKPASTSGATTTKKPASVSYYKYKTKAGLSTSTSIVDALKAIGVDSSMSNRKKIAQANGISNYTGSYSQNVQLLSKLKSGKLKKV